MEKINIAELLKDCPRGMELDCTMWDNVYFDRVEDDLIHCYYELDGYRNTTFFCKNGCFTAHKLSKCVIFPKGKTTWEGFQRPFKDGDIITCTNSICTFVAIYKCMYDKNLFYRYARLILNYRRFSNGEMHFSPNCTWSDFANPRFATEEEKEILFKAIKDNGYRWNPETKTLEKLIEPKFKVGDIIRHKHNSNGTDVIIDILNDRYVLRYCYLYFKDQDNYELFQNKFDISTLKPFESRVLVRNVDHHEWKPAFWGYYSKEYVYPFVVAGGNTFAQCIPYEGNEHLRGTTDECDEYYKTWK